MVRFPPPKSHDTFCPPIGLFPNCLGSKLALSAEIPCKWLAITIAILGGTKLLALQVQCWLFAHKPSAAPNRPKPPQTPKFPENPALPRNPSKIPTEFILSAIQNPTEFPWVFPKFLEFPHKIAQIPPNPLNIWENKGRRGSRAISQSPSLCSVFAREP